MSWEQEQKVIMNKKKLVGKQIIIENDLTQAEREIQKELRGIAKNERLKGNTAKLAIRNS